MVSFIFWTWTVYYGLGWPWAMRPFGVAHDLRSRHPGRCLLPLWRRSFWGPFLNLWANDVQSCGRLRSKSWNYCWESEWSTGFSRNQCVFRDHWYPLFLWQKLCSFLSRNQHSQKLASYNKVHCTLISIWSSAFIWSRDILYHALRVFRSESLLNSLGGYWIWAATGTREFSRGAFFSMKQNKKLNNRPRSESTFGWPRQAQLLPLGLT